MASQIGITNPFSITSYLGAEYFCDRIEETRNLSDALHNRRNVTLISPRRVGKTGLIQHLFHSLDTNEVHCIYVDLFSTSNLQDFTKVFAESVLSARINPFSERVWEEITHFFGALRPVFGMILLVVCRSVRLMCSLNAKNGLCSRFLPILRNQLRLVMWHWTSSKPSLNTRM